MKLQNFLIFMVVFLAVSMGTPFILATILPTVYAIIGSLGVSIVAGIILFVLLGYAGKEASPSQ